MFEIEEIPDKDKLYYRIHINEFINGEVIPGAFVERGDGVSRSMSTDWQRYSSPEILKSRARNPNKVAILSFIKAIFESLTNLFHFFSLKII